jgi:hypothetical protein
MAGHARRGEDVGDTALRLRQGQSAETNRASGEDDHDPTISASHGTSIIARDGRLEVGGGNALVNDTPHSAPEAGSTEVDKQQDINHVEPIVADRHFDEAPTSVAKPPVRTLSCTTVLDSGSPGLGEAAAAMVDISTFTMTRILGQRTGRLGSNTFASPRHYGCRVPW